MSKKIGLAVIGIRGYGQKYFDMLKKETDVEVVAICDIDEEAAKAVAQKHGVPNVVADYHKMLELPGIDAVLIAIPHHLHYQVARACLEAGKHVFCEKPLTIDVEESYDLARRAEKAGLILTCHYNRRQYACEDAEKNDRGWRVW